MSITAPSSEAAFTAPASITISASASDDGTIATVDFYANETLIATTTSSPYSFSWSGVDAGSYSLTAVARDDSGNTTASSTRDIIVRSATLPNTAVFVPASDHETAVHHYVLDVFPSGADPTVANSVLSVDLGKPTITEGECRVDISTIILGLAPGDYIATVTAVGSGTSAPTAIHAVTTLMRPSAILSTLCAQPRTNSSS
ncbi:MAG TPA: Ig-like domain-containing protein [Vicinamibacterales bacterium]|nr:Ig-like domain-containing protein [Vicinamibacterales bacterium]